MNDVKSIQRSQSSNTITPTTSPSDLQGKSILEVLPNELLAQCLGYLEPNLQTSFALASKQSLMLSNQSTAPRVPFPARVTHGRAMEWTRRYNDLTPGVRRSLEVASQLFPNPDIFSSLERELARVRKMSFCGVTAYVFDPPTVPVDGAH